MAEARAQTNYPASRRSPLAIWHAKGYILTLPPNAADAHEPMLKSTFCHIPGISTSTELKLWSVGMRSWDCFDAAEAAQGIKEQAQLDGWLRDG